jgi:hypothetical protein
MGSFQFVACSDEGCPMNKDRQCRAGRITVDDDGRCLVRNMPPGPKSETEGYVELCECRCTSCVHWALDDIKEEGQCTLSNDLFFTARNTCNDYEKQIKEPGYTARL